MEFIKTIVKDIAKKEYNIEIEVIFKNISPPEKSGYYDQTQKTIFFNNLVPKGWGIKEIIELALHELAHIPKKSLGGKIPFIMARKLEIKYKNICEDSEMHNVCFWREFERLKKKYEYLMSTIKKRRGA
ncbi:MAG: hypothetical protein Q8R04_02225 [Nanoarchaeota archaeon]|nr:hypothetical protein [Nanoarchaeota archaeon]